MTIYSVTSLDGCRNSLHCIRNAAWSEGSLVGGRFTLTEARFESIAELCSITVILNDVSAIFNFYITVFKQLALFVGVNNKTCNNSLEYAIIIFTREKIDTSCLLNREKPESSFFPSFSFFNASIILDAVIPLPV